MITDKLLRVSEDQLLDLNAASAVSTDTIDLSQNRDIGEGEELYFNFAITTAVAKQVITVDLRLSFMYTGTLTIALPRLLLTQSLSYVHVNRPSSVEPGSRRLRML